MRYSIPVQCLMCNDSALTGYDAYGNTTCRNCGQRWNIDLLTKLCWKMSDKDDKIADLEKQLDRYGWRPMTEVPNHCDTLFMRVEIDGAKNWYRSIRYNTAVKRWQSLETYHYIDEAFSLDKCSWMEPPK